MPHVLIVNPSDRKVKTMATKKRTPAQQRATKRMIAANKARSKSRRAPVKSAARPAVSRAKPKRRTGAVRSVARKSAPKRSRPRVSAVQASSAGRTLRYRRPNPDSKIASFFQDTLLPSGIGAAGALAVDVGLGLGTMKLAPETRAKIAPFLPVIKVAGAVGLGMAAASFTNKRVAHQIAAGAITVTLYDVLKSAVNKMTGGKVPGLSEYPDMGEYVGEYVAGDDDAAQVGYDDAAMQVGDGEVLMPDGSIEGYETGVYR